MWWCCVRQVRFHVKHWIFALSIGPWTGLLLLWLNFSLEKSSHSNATTFNGSWEILPGTQLSRHAKTWKWRAQRFWLCFVENSETFASSAKTFPLGRINSNVQCNIKMIFSASTFSSSEPWWRLSASRKIITNNVFLFAPSRGPAYLQSTLSLSFREGVIVSRPVWSGYLGSYNIDCQNVTPNMIQDHDW